MLQRLRTWRDDPFGWDLTFLLLTVKKFALEKNSCSSTRKIFFLHGLILNKERTNFATMVSTWDEVFGSQNIVETVAYVSVPLTCSSADLQPGGGMSWEGVPTLKFI